MNALIATVLGLRGPIVCAAISALVFAEAAAFVGLVVPGEAAMIVAGGLAAHGTISLHDSGRPRRSRRSARPQVIRMAILSQSTVLVVGFVEGMREGDVLAPFDLAPFDSGVSADVGGRGELLMRVLVVEDERNLAESVRRGLIAEGMVVDVAHDGVTGQWLATENPYDVIVLDIMLPGRHGYEVLKNLRELGVWSPVLMLTAKDGEYDQADAFDLGADDYLTKPFHFIVLVARLRALARRGAPERPVTLEVGDITLDPVRRTVTCCGQPVALTAKQYAVLQFMMRHPDEVVSKAEILDNVWDPAFDGSQNIVEVYMGYLRRKVDTAFNRTSIETVRGMGYRLLAVRREGAPS